MRKYLGAFGYSYAVLFVLSVLVTPNSTPEMLGTSIVIKFIASGLVAIGVLLYDILQQLIELNKKK